MMMCCDDDVLKEEEEEAAAAARWSKKNKKSHGNVGKTQRTFKGFKETFCSIIFVFGPIAGGSIDFTFFQNKERSSLCHARGLHHRIVYCCPSCAKQ